MASLPSTGATAQEEPRLRSGPMVGYGEMTEVMLWVQTSAPARIRYRFWPEADTASVRSSAASRTTLEEYCTARVLITRLTPGTRNRNRLSIDRTQLCLPQHPDSRPNLSGRGAPTRSTSVLPSVSTST
jgi:alkaline phosphatase D